MQLVIGLGETGRPLYDILSNSAECGGIDAKHGFIGAVDPPVSVLHICIPYMPDFVDIVKAYQATYSPNVTVIHSTVPIGTTKLIDKAVHSPILGRHARMREDMMLFDKWVGGELAEEVRPYLEAAGFKVRTVESSDETEMLKLLCLANYGVNIAFAQYAADLCKEHGVDYNHVIEWNLNYNKGVDDICKRPILTPPDGKIGGHCVIQNTAILNRQHPNPMLMEVLKYSGRSYKTWGISNIYPSAKIGDNANIGWFCEIGHNVEIGDNTRIGAFSFIPEGVSIGRDVFIGPRVTFTNDKYPPSGKENWLPTVIKDGARIGAATTIICGVTVGEGALVGAGSVVTKNVPAGETWAGVPARKME